MNPRLLASILFVFTLLAGLTVNAQDNDVVARVEQHFEAGASLFQAGHYEKAIREFEAGYALYPDPILLYNISLAHGKLGRINKSLTVAELAEATKLQEPDRTQNMSRMIALRSAKSASAIAPQVALLVAETQRAEQAAQADKKRRDEEEKGVSALGWAGVGTAAAGGLLLVGSLVVDASIGADIDAYKNAADRGDQAEYDRLKANIESKQSTAKVLLFSGIGLAAVGAGLVIYDLFFPGEPEAAVTLIPTSDGFAASYLTHF